MSLRRRFALWICPELGLAPVQPTVAEKSEVGGKEALLALSEALAAHQDVTHFAISMRIMGKGDFFKGLMRPGADCRTRTAERVLSWFDANWPADLEWPRDISRPRPQKKKEAA